MQVSVGLLDGVLLIVALVMSGCATTNQPATVGTGLWNSGPRWWNSVAFSPDGHYLAAGESQPLAVVFFDVASGAESSRFKPTKEFNAARLGALIWATNGQALAALVGKKETAIWDVTSSNLLARLPSAGSLALSRNGRWVAGGGHNSIVYLCQIGGGQEPLAISNGSSAVVALAFSPDGHVLATADKHREIRFWDTATGNRIGRLPRQDYPVHSIAFADTGDLLAVSALDVSLWRTEGGRLGTVASPSLGAASQAIGTLYVLAGTLYYGLPIFALPRLFGRLPAGMVAFSPDGKLLAIVSSAANADVALGADEQQVRVIEIATGRQLATIARGAYIESAAFSPDGQRLATAGKLGVDLWDWREKPQQNTSVIKPIDRAR
jgi:WD40 repeat protein